MKTPDKICVAPHQITDYDLDIQDVGHNGAVEYIRKDALVEWLKERISDGDEEGLMTNQIANLAYKDVIDKINSL